MTSELTPKQIVAELDKHIVGQTAAKRAVAIAIRNRWRRAQLSADAQKNIIPKNIIMIGPTGVGKTEIARRLAALVGAPFIKVEATKYTEVGYHGRDVESMIRDLTEAAAGIIRSEQRRLVETKAQERVLDRLLELLMPSPRWDPEPADDKEAARLKRSREKMRAKLAAGELDDKMVELTIEQKTPTVQVLGGMGFEQMDMDFQSMFEKIIPKQAQQRQVTVKEARQILLEQESEALIDKQVVSEKAVALAENQGIIFLDELDKLGGPSSSHGPDVSRQGVQRDLLPIVEGTTTQTRYGPVRSDHILFIAAGAFHMSKPSDLMPELQGRFPIRVELTDLTRDDFIRILTEPQHALTKQYTELLQTEGLQIQFSEDAIKVMAELAYEVNRTQQNIGARRLHTIIERVVEDISFEGADYRPKKMEIQGPYVREKLEHLMKREDLGKFIL